MSHTYYNYYLLLISCLALPANAQNYELINSSNIETIFNNSKNVIASQLGNFNQLEVFTNDQNLKIEQIGSANQFNFIDSSTFSLNNAQSNFKMIGNQNNISVYGSNSISDNMTLIQQSNNKTITIINR